jgi:hypothetical protein
MGSYPLFYDFLKQRKNSKVIVSEEFEMRGQARLDFTNDTRFKSGAERNIEQ